MSMPQPLPQNPPVHQPPAKPRRRWIPHVVGSVFLAVIVGLWIAMATSGTSDPADSEPTASELELVRQTCAAGSSYVTVSGDGRTLTVETAGSYGDGASITELGCVVTGLGAPESVIFQMEQTRALDGMQVAEWGGYSAKWTYHPDNGFALVVESDPFNW